MRPLAPSRERSGSGGGGGSAMAEERSLAMVTCTAPVNIAVIKYCESRRPAGGWRLSLGPEHPLGAGEPPGRDPRAQRGGRAGGAETPGSGAARWRGRV